jgi:serine protease inhibitor
MPVIYNCIHCGKEIKSDFNYEGSLSGINKWVEEKTRNLSEKCECRKKDYSIITDDGSEC